jgi:hypothetical protein
MWRQLLAALLLSIACAFVHAIGSSLNFLGTVRVFRRYKNPSVARAWFIMLRIMAVMLVLHAAEIAIWAQFYIWQRCFNNAETAYYFSLVTYTTLGYGDVLLPAAWRITGAWEAVIGVLMFGWSTASLVAFIHHVYIIKTKDYYLPGE